MTDVPSAVLWLDQVRATDAPAVGAKAARLGELSSRGFPVPPGFVVTADAYRAAFRRLEPDGDPHRGLETLALPEALSAAIGDAYGRLVRDCGPALECAVRSSATAEDLAGASFAGQPRKLKSRMQKGMSKVPFCIHSCMSRLRGACSFCGPGS